MVKGAVMSKELCTDLEMSRMLAQTGIMADVEADGYWYEEQPILIEEVSEGKYKIGSSNGIYRGITECRFEFKTEEAANYNGALIGRGSYFQLLANAYRLDRLLMKLPEWYFNICNSRCESFRDCIYDVIPKEGSRIQKEIVDLITEIFFSKGQQAANSAARLLCLLHGEGLLR